MNSIANLTTLFYFNSRPCERGFQVAMLEGAMSGISIHAPARGASIYRIPHRGIRYYFNSRPCERGFDYVGAEMSYSIISIHAPARGASLSQLKLLIM